VRPAAVVVEGYKCYRTYAYMLTVLTELN